MIRDTWPSTVQLGLILSAVVVVTLAPWFIRANQLDSSEVYNSLWSVGCLAGLGGVWRAVKLWRGNGA